MDTPLLDRIREINKRGKMVFEKRRCLKIMDKSEINLMLDQIERERLSKQEFIEHFIPRKIDPDTDIEL